MGKRRAWNAAPPKPFDGAFERINDLERAVGYRAVTTRITAREALEWLYPAEVIHACTVAYPYVDDTWTHSVTVNVFGGALEINTNGAQMLAPKNGVVTCPKGVLRENTRICAVLEGLNAVVERFNTVRDVVAWFNEHGTPAAAKYYFPHMGALLPETHEFHKCDGQRHREPVVPICSAAIRLAGTIVAEGLLAGTADQEAGKVKYFAHTSRGKAQAFVID